MITQERLKELLHYDPETGVFTWRVARSNVRIGAAAGTVMPVGYRYLRVDGRQYYAHRAAWLYVYGCWPHREIDHINRNKDDNRIANLRDVGRTENTLNRARQSNNTTGVTGVYRHSATKPYRAIIKVGQRAITLGYFDKFEDAVAARRSAENRYWTASSVSQ